MKKLFVAAVLISATAACGSKKASTTPGTSKVEPRTGDVGGAGYGGAAYGGHAKTPAANPCSTAH